MRIVLFFALIAMAAACPVTPAPSDARDGGQSVDSGNPPSDGGLTRDGGEATADAGVTPASDTGAVEDAGEQPSNDLIGTWLAQTDEDEPLGLAFREDNRMLILEDLNPCTARQGTNYTIEGSTLVLDIDGGTRVPFSWDGEALLLETEDGQLRFARTSDNCHVVPEAADIIGTWEVLDDEDPETPSAIAFTDNGEMMLLSDQAQCDLIQSYDYRTEGDQLILSMGDQENSVPFTLNGDEMVIDNETRLRLTQADCHERYRESGDLPPALIGTYSADPAPPQGAVLIALRADNTMVGISEQAGCVEAYSWPVSTYGQSLLVETEDGRFPLRWRQEGSSVILTTAEGDELNLSRVRTDCHTLP